MNVIRSKLGHVISIDAIPGICFLVTKIKLKIKEVQLKSDARSLKLVVLVGHLNRPTELVALGLVENLFNWNAVLFAPKMTQKMEKSTRAHRKRKTTSKRQPTTKNLLM